MGRRLKLEQVRGQTGYGLFYRVIQLAKAGFQSGSQHFRSLSNGGQPPYLKTLGN
jgi:hypothetical protein